MEPEPCGGLGNALGLRQVDVQQLETSGGAAVRYGRQEDARDDAREGLLASRQVPRAEEDGAARGVARPVLAPKTCAAKGKTKNRKQIRQKTERQIKHRQETESERKK